MSNSFSSTDSLDPDVSYAHTSSVGQAANDLRAAAGEKAREFVHSAEEKANALKVAAVDKAQQFKENAAEQWDDTRIKAREMHLSAEDYIRENPTKCVLSALGVGFLIGLIVRR